VVAGWQDRRLAQTCKELMHMPIVWVDQRFKAMGRRDARDLAFALLASYEGIALLTNAFRDPELMIREGRLYRFITRCRCCDLRIGQIG
jgi:TetR/AcrR family transcriptional regulator, transcriptional repressor for nem operon